MYWAISMIVASNKYPEKRGLYLATKAHLISVINKNPPLNPKFGINRRPLHLCWLFER